MAFLPALTASLTLHPTHAVPMAGHECQTGVNTLSVSLNAKKTRETDLQHYCRSDDVRTGFQIAEWGLFDNPKMLQSSPTSFKLV